MGEVEKAIADAMTSEMPAERAIRIPASGVDADDAVRLSAAILGVNGLKETLFRESKIMMGHQLNLVNHAQVLRSWCILNGVVFVKMKPGKKEGDPMTESVYAPSLATCADVLGNKQLHDSNLPELHGVTLVPLIKPNTDILCSEGYDRETGWWGNLKPMTYGVSTAEEHVAYARKLILDELLGDFCWASDGDKAHAVAAVLTGVSRLLFTYPLPMWVINATNPGSGKGTLASAVGELWGGANMRPFAGDDAEIRKTILPALTSSQPVVIFDNVEGILGGPSLAGLLTAPTWTDRILGSSRQATADNNKLWVATGNGIQLGNDISRRTFWSTLTPTIDPTTRARTEFRHPDLVAWVKENRALLEWATVVLVKDWAEAGMKPGSVTLESYESWSQMMGGVLAHHGVAGFLDGSGPVKGMTVSAMNLDKDSEELMEMVAVLYGTFGTDDFSAGDVADQITDRMNSMLMKTLPSKVYDKWKSGGDGGLRKSIGWWLRWSDGRFCGEGNGRLVKTTGSRDRKHLYKVEPDASWLGSSVEVERAEQRATAALSTETDSSY